MIKIQNLKINYGKEDILKQKDIALSSSNLIVICGESGSGKTSLLDFIALEHNFGELNIDGHLIDFSNQEELHNYKYNHITYIKPDSQYIPGLTCHEILEYTINCTQNNIDINHLLLSLGLELSHKTKLTDLSKGQQVLFGIAYAVSKNDQIILLDEPFGNLDEEAIQNILPIIYDMAHNGKYVIMTYHLNGSDIDEVVTKHCDSLIRLENHKIILQKVKIGTDVEYKAINKKIDFTLLRKSILNYSQSHNRIYKILIILVLGSLMFVYSDISSAKNRMASLEALLKYTSSECILKNSAYASYGNNLGIDKNIIDQIGTMEEIDSIVSSIPFVITPYYNYDEEGNYITDPEIYDVVVNNDLKKLAEFKEGEACNFYIVPYLNNYYDSVCEGKINEDGILYLSSSLASSLGIKNEQEEIEINCLIPIDSSVNELYFYSSTGDSFNYYEQSPTYKKVKIKAKVRGIISNNFPLNQTNCFLLPQSMMNSLYNEYAIENTHYQIPEYIVSLKEGTDQFELEKKINKLSEDVTLQFEGKEALESMKSILSINQNSNMYMALLGFLTVALCIAFSFTEAKCDQSYLATIDLIGIDLKTQKQLLKYKIIRSISDFTIIGSAIVIGMIIILHGIFRNNIESYRYFDLKNILIILISLMIINVISQLKSIIWMNQK